MANTHKLTKTDCEVALRTLSNWKMVNERDAIEKQFVFADFNTAIGWMIRVAIFAEVHDHHPEWSNIYRTIDVVLTTHDLNGVSNRDIEMAHFMDSAAGDMRD